MRVTCKAPPMSRALGYVTVLRVCKQATIARSPVSRTGHTIRTTAYPTATPHFSPTARSTELAKRYVRCERERERVSKASVLGATHDKRTTSAQLQTTYSTFARYHFGQMTDTKEQHLSSSGDVGAWAALRCVPRLRSFNLIIVIPSNVVSFSSFAASSSSPAARFSARRRGGRLREHPIRRHEEPLDRQLPDQYHPKRRDVEFEKCEPHVAVRTCAHAPTPRCKKEHNLQTTLPT